MARSSYIINAPTTGGGGAIAEDHDHGSTYYTQFQADSRFLNITGDTLQGPLDWVRVTGTDRVLGARVDGDTFDRISISADGKISFSSGNAASDIAFVRSGLGEITTEGSLVVDGSLVVTGSISTSVGSLDADTLAGQTAVDLLSRTNHTGTQSSSTIFDIVETIQDTVAEALGAYESQPAYGIQVTYNDLTGRVNVDYTPPYVPLNHDSIGDWDQAVMDTVGASVTGSGDANVSYNPTTGAVDIFVQPTPFVYSFGVVEDTPTLNLTDLGNNTLKGDVLDSPTVGGFTPVQLRDRSTHTGSQLSSTISDLGESVSDIVGAMVTGNTETGISVTYQDSDNTLDFVLSYGTAVNISDTSTSSAGSGSAVARANHTHAITGFLPIAGGTITGALTLNADPAEPLQASTKQYVDELIDTHIHNDLYYTETEVNILLSTKSDDTHTHAHNHDANYLQLDGGAMTGPLVLATDPIDPFQAATKQYVDAIDPEIDTSTLMGHVNFGDDSNYPRPNVEGAVIWVGLVEPLNKLPGDFWFYAGGTLEPETDTLVLAGYTETVGTNATAAGAVALDVTVTNVFDLTLTGNVTLALENPPITSGWSMTIITKQDATGGRIITWPTSVKWPNGTAPVPATTANAVNLWALTTTNGGVTWYGYLSGKGMA